MQHVLAKRHISSVFRKHHLATFLFRHLSARAMNVSPHVTRFVIDQLSRSSPVRKSLRYVLQVQSDSDIEDIVDDPAADAADAAEADNNIMCAPSADALASRYHSSHAHLPFVKTSSLVQRRRPSSPEVFPPFPFASSSDSFHQESNRRKRPPLSRCRHSRDYEHRGGAAFCGR
jgi:hypothetical protein